MANDVSTLLAFNPDMGSGVASLLGTAIGAGRKSAHHSMYASKGFMQNPVVLRGIILHYCLVSYSVIRYA
ncbi:hypothetical protein BDV24DRAFT_137426 [Aspergillus arachidicola]|uniref:Uncharacterized protein n=1 Tax=Aspergillus arachidicola TaxID=656916 RepID=A0A5N6Y316_9EURO|nr:hypothetical protein BDV24DRAFT_137426 [Aspergillus arachidicola]